MTWAHVLIGFSLGYYVRFKSGKVLAMAFLLLLSFWLLIAIKPHYLLEGSIVAFVVAWIGQFYGHKIEGKKPSFFEDLFFLLISPYGLAKVF